MVTHPTTPVLSSLNASENQTISTPLVPFDRCSLPIFTEFIFQSVFLVLITVVTFVGNVAVCLTVLLNDSLRTFTNYLVTSLAISDLMVATFSLPFRIHQTVHNTSWCLSQDACLFWVWVDLFCCCASIGNLALISVDRFLATRYPFTYEQMITRRRGAAMIAVVWTYSFVVASSGLTNWTSPGATVVGIDNGCYKFDSYFYTFAAAIGFFLPLAVVACAYSYVLKVALQHWRAIRRVSPIVLPEPAQEHVVRTHKALKRELKATKTLAVVVGVFVMCWLPTFIILIVNIWCRSCFDSGHNPHLAGFFTFVNITFVYTFPNLNSALNPFIYVVFSKTLRGAFVRLFGLFAERMANSRAQSN